MDCHIAVLRKTSTIYLDGKETTSIFTVKKMLEGILRVSPEDQQLVVGNDVVMENNKILSDYSITTATAKPQSPSVIKLSVRNENGHFEPLEIMSYSSPPEIPYVMKGPEATGE